MKDLILDPEDCLYSHETDLEKLQKLEQAILNGTWDTVPPVYVVASEKIPGKYLIYNGINRLHIARVFNKPLRAVLIESSDDLTEIPYKEHANWPYVNWYVKPEDVHLKSEYERLVLKICDWALHRPNLPRGPEVTVDWHARHKKDLEKILSQLPTY